jgi:anti-sigma-K factor RskA
VIHPEIVDLAPQYVLGELDEASRARMATHLETCADCVAEVRAQARVLDALGRSVPQVDPPAQLRDRVMAIAGRSRTDVAVAGGPSATARVPWLAAIAASLVAIMALGQAWNAGREVARLRDEVADLRRAASVNDAARTALLQRAGDAERLAGVLQSADVLRFDLTGLAPAPSARARAFVNPRDAMVITADGLPALPADKIYQLWAIVGSTPISIGTFAPDASGHAQGVMSLPRDLARPDVVAVTLEPAPGVPSPTGAMYLKSH